jgi:hypothetical protein
VGKTETVPVTTRALIQRINRKLAAQGQTLRKARGASCAGLGDYYVIDTRRNAVTLKRVGLEALGRELEALHPWESLAD